jgi:hypothetical protein
MMLLRGDTGSKGSAGRSALALLTWCMVMGCGGSPVAKQFPVEGAIRWPDETDAGELAGGTVEFEANGAVAGKAEVISDGTFTLENPLPAGKYRIRVIPPPAAKSMLDAKYQDFAKSGFTADVSSEPQSIPLKVTKRR